MQRVNGLMLDATSKDLFMNSMFEWNYVYTFKNPR